MERLRELLRSHIIAIVILLSVIILAVPTLGRDLLTDWDECIYTDYAKTMSISKNISVHYWNEKPALEKPPLNSILMQIPFLFGINEFTARITTFTLGIMLLLAIYLFARKVFSLKTAILSLLIIMSLDLYMYYMLHVNTDIGFSLFIFCGIIFWIISLKKESKSYLLSGLFFGLAVLQKGPGIIPYLSGMFIINLLYFRKTLSMFFKICFISLAVSLPWHIYAYLMFEQKFISIYILENIIQRAKYPIEFHIEGRLFYIRLLLKQYSYMLVFPIIAFGVILLKNFRSIISLRKINLTIERHYVFITLCTISIVTLIMITRIRTRISWYIIPLLPIISIIIGESISQIISQFRSEKIKRVLFSVVFFILVIQSFILVIQSTNPHKTERTFTPQYEVLLISSELPHKELYYLVRYSERRAREILNENLYTSTTWIFGGNPCARYYSSKKVNYFYSTEEFNDFLNVKGRLYLIENGDSWMIEKTFPIILFKNSDFTLFSY